MLATFEPDLDSPNSSEKRKPVGPLIIFVHGLSGSPKSTWGNMAKCIADDSSFRNYVVDYYGYPTRLMRLPFTPPLPGLDDLARGLRTLINEKHPHAEIVHIVAHSLGGLIARRMIVGDLERGRDSRVTSLTLFAVPNTGSALADVGDAISRMHNQLKALCKDVIGLNNLNAVWSALKVEEKVRVKYIIGGCDRVVSAESGYPHADKDDVSVIIDAAHRNIVSPTGIDDIKYVALKKFILGINKSTNRTESYSSLSKGKGDPLFDIYRKEDEPFYIHRKHDDIIKSVILNQHLWLTGASGIGKTASLRRAVTKLGWKFYHINLAAHSDQTAEGIFRGMCAEIASMFDTSLSEFTDISGLVRCVASILRNNITGYVTAYIIEEIPLCEIELRNFVNIVAKLIDHIDADETLTGRLRFVLSSRLKVDVPEISSSRLDARLRERIQFIPVQEWSGKDMVDLIDMISSVIAANGMHNVEDIIFNHARGSPRFVKVFYRHIRNGTSSGMTVEELCYRVSQELVQ